MAKVKLNLGGERVVVRGFNPSQIFYNKKRSPCALCPAVHWMQKALVALLLAASIVILNQAPLRVVLLQVFLVERSVARLEQSKVVRPFAQRPPV